MYLKWAHSAHYSDYVCCAASSGGAAPSGGDSVSGWDYKAYYPVQNTVKVFVNKVRNFLLTIICTSTIIVVDTSPLVGGTC